jgi:hypothetical protein
MAKTILFVNIIIKVLTVYIFKNVDSFDIRSFTLIGRLILKGINIYPNQAALYSPYLPFFLYFEGLAAWLEKFITTSVSLRLIYLFFDFGTAYLIYLLSKKNKTIALIYLFNPITILVTFVHGQFDVIPLFFILWSFYLLQTKKELASVLIMSLAILAKTWPIFFIIPYIKKLKNKNLSFFLPIIPTVAVLFYSLLYKSSVFDVFFTTIGYRSLFSIWGIGKLVKLIFYSNLSQPPIFIQKILLYLFLLIFFAYSFFLKHKKLLLNILELLMFFYIFTVGFAPQYLCWLAPFLILCRPKYWLGLLAIITVFLIFNYGQWFTDFSLIKNLADFFNYLSWLAFIFFYVYWKKNRFQST